MSLLKAIKAQLGISNTPANNFTLDASADNGTMKLARGNAGATTQDILTVDANGRVSFPQSVVAFHAYQSSAQTLSAGVHTKINLQSEVYDTANSFDSTTNFRFQPNVAGYYQINGAVRADAASLAAIHVSLIKNASLVFAAGSFTNSALNGFMSSASGLVYLNGSTDFVEMNSHAGQSTLLTVGVGFTYMSGILIAKA